MPSRRLPGMTDDTSSPGLSLPYDTVPGRRIRVSAADPSATRGHVRGLVTSFAALTTGPPDAYASERPWALPFKVFPSSQSVPLSGPLPSCRYPLPLLRPEELHWTTRPASGPCSCDESVLSPEPQVIPAADPFLGFDPPELAPDRPGVRFGRDASPLTLWRLDVKARLGLRVLRDNRVG